MKLRHMLMLAAVAVAAYLAFFADKAPQTGVSEVLPLNGQVVSVVSAVKQSNIVKTNASPIVQTSLLETTKPDGKALKLLTIYELQDRKNLIVDGHISSVSEGIFVSQSWTPPLPPPPKIVPVPPPPPTAPPLTFTYLGKMKIDNMWEVYLARGEKVIVVRADKLIDGVYQVSSILPPTLTLIYLPLKQMQYLNIGAAD